MGRRCGFHVGRYSGRAPNAAPPPGAGDASLGDWAGAEIEDGRVYDPALPIPGHTPVTNSVSRPVAVACGTSFLCRGRVSWSMLRVGGPTASLEAFKCRSLRPKAWRLAWLATVTHVTQFSEALGPSKLTRVDTWRLCCESVARCPPSAASPYLARFAHTWRLSSASRGRAWRGGEYRPAAGAA